MTDFGLIFSLFAIAAGAIASVAGFGIGSILTPILAVSIGTKLAVSAVCIPHLVATSWRCWILRRHIDKKVLLNFGITSAVGGFVGALLHAQAQSYLLTVLFGSLLVLVSVLSLTGYDAKMRFGTKRSGLAGAVSGVLGGMVGNQGGIRSAAMLNFNLSKESFVGTATAIGVLVDLARLPVYLTSEAKELFALWPSIAIATGCTLLGTFLGMKLLVHVPQKIFKRIVASIILVLGFAVLLRGSV
jgi:uncharacterized membrane protein YfcA